jgi:cytosine/uracil/thiamine/allantoin permease
VRIKRVYAVSVDVTVTFLGSIYFMLVAGSFYGPFITFISLLAIPITAWLGVFLVDMIKRHYYDPVQLLDLSSAGAYYYRGGLEPRAVGSWALAILVGYLLLANGLSGIAWLVTLVVAGAAYFLLGGARGTLTEPQSAASPKAADSRV